MFELTNNGSSQPEMSGISRRVAVWNGRSAAIFSVRQSNKSVLCHVTYTFTDVSEMYSGCIFPVKKPPVLN